MGGVLEPRLSYLKFHTSDSQSARKFNSHQSYSQSVSTESFVSLTQRMNLTDKRLSLERSLIIGLLCGSLRERQKAKLPQK